MPEVTIQMRLLDEGTDVWRPVKAERVSNDTYRVLGPTPTDEKWAFSPGTIIRCRLQQQSGDRGITTQPRPRAVALFVWYNFFRTQKTYKLSPAMAARVTDRLMSMEDVAALVEARAPLPGKRGPYRKRADVSQTP